MRYAKYGMGGMLGAAGYVGAAKKNRSGFVYANTGTAVPQEDTDPKKKKDTSTVRDNFERVPTAEVSYRNNEGMMEAQSEGKIDAYNFELPSSGMLDDLDEATKERLVNTDFGDEYLSGGGSLDAQYNAYAAKVNTFMESDPEGALAVVNQMIESGNPNFQVLQGKSDAEKLDMAKRYMTDKKIGDFHGALQFGEKVMPKASFYDPTDAVKQAGFRGGSYNKVLRSVGDKMLKPGDVMAFQRFADEMGIDVSEDTADSRRAFNMFVGERGSGDFSKGQYDGKDNEMFVQEAGVQAKQGLQSAAQRAKARREQAMKDIERQKAAQRSGGMGMRISKYADEGAKVPTEEQRERGVTSTSKGIFNKTEKFGDKGEVKYPTRFGSLFTKKSLKASF